MARKSDGGNEGIDPRDNAAHWEKAMAWVDGNGDNIRRYITKFLPYSAYALDDFMQEALAAAHGTYCLTADRRLSVRHYAGFFWTAFHSKCCDLSGDIPKHLKVPHETAVELKVAVGATDGDHGDGLSDSHAEAALALLPARQGQVWRLLLESKSQRQIGELLGLSEQAVSNSANRGFTRLKEALARVETGSGQPMIEGFAVHMAIPGTKAEVKRKLRRRRLKKVAIPGAGHNRQTELLLTMKSKASGKLRRAPLAKAVVSPHTAGKCKAARHVDRTGKDKKRG